MSEKTSKPISASIKESREYHVRYLRAINSHVRRRILRALKQGCASIEDLQASIGLDRKTMEWHLDVLEHGSCVKKRIKRGIPVYEVTQEGKVVDFLE